MRVHYTNFDYYAEPTFATLTDAIAYGISKGFEFAVLSGSMILATWSPIGGLRTIGY
jgi:hypothetical protein